MARKILLTSLGATETEMPIRYFSVRNEFDFSYCDALLDAEASVKALLARYDIDEVIVIGGEGAYDEGDDLTPAPLTRGRDLYSANRSDLSGYGLLQYRIAQYADELNRDGEAEKERLPEGAREKLIRFRNYRTMLAAH